MDFKPGARGAWHYEKGMRWATLTGAQNGEWEVFQMMANAPPTKKGPDYFFTKGNALFTGVDTFYLDGDTLTLELKEFVAEFSGDPIWHVNRSPDGRPTETMTIAKEVRQNGPTAVGTLVRAGGTDTTQTGAFT